MWFFHNYFLHNSFVFFVQEFSDQVNFVNDVSFERVDVVIDFWLLGHFPIW